MDPISQSLNNPSSRPRSSWKYVEPLQISGVNIPEGMLDSYEGPRDAGSGSAYQTTVLFYVGRKGAVGKFSSCTDAPGAPG